MKTIKFFNKTEICGAEIQNILKNMDGILKEIPSKKYEDSLGWFNVNEHANDKILDEIENVAEEIRKNADVFVLIGVGGSNQSARAVISALNPFGTPEILYAGINLSPNYMQQVLNKLEGKNVYINVIAKNFKTLEPGITFRFFRDFLNKKYGDKANEHIIVTGSLEGDVLLDFSKEKGYKFLKFPKNIGGRYSAISSVGLLPMAVCGINIREIKKGAGDMADYLLRTPKEDNPAILYAASRNAFYNKGFTNEILTSFEPELFYFSKWWVQLFAESEGKDSKGIYPSSCSFSEDLHSVGQYIQDGKKILIETFLSVENIEVNMPIVSEKGNKDEFGYLDDKTLGDVNKAAFEGTVKAHKDGNIPVMIIEVPKLNEYYFGQLFYFFQYACYVSGSILGVNPFDQPGVEAYKKNLFDTLYN